MTFFKKNKTMHEGSISSIIETLRRAQDTKSPEEQIEILESANSDLQNVIHKIQKANYSLHGRVLGEDTHPHEHIGRS